MDYFPVFIKVKGKSALVVGGNEEALHKIRLLRKSAAKIIVFGSVFDPTLQNWIEGGLIEHHPREITLQDLDNAAFAYISTEDAARRDHAIALFQSALLPYCVIDDKARSSFITPALVDRDPVVVAIGTEGTGPVIARDIKARVEAELSPLTGIVAKVAGAFRQRVEHLPHGAPRRQFWQRYLDEVVPSIEETSPENPEQHLLAGLEHLLAEGDTRSRSVIPCPVRAVNISVGNTDLLTRQASSWLHDADLVIYHSTTPEEVLELTRRESTKMVWSGEAASFSGATELLAAACQGRSVVIITPDESLPVTESSLSEAGLRLERAAYIGQRNRRDDVFIPSYHREPQVLTRRAS
jgi:uroporphyrin-III C-methyltransferase/precorrin-2 dehydrogenase/sirohydrochlorin ferrochelatase